MGDFMVDSTTLKRLIFNTDSKLNFLIFLEVFIASQFFNFRVFSYLRYRAIFFQVVNAVYYKYNHLTRS